jgi:hypothetical protein
LATSDCIVFAWEEAGLDLPSAVRITISSRLQRDVQKIGRLSTLIGAKFARDCSGLWKFEQR